MQHNFLPLASFSFSFLSPLTTIFFPALYPPCMVSSLQQLSSPRFLSKNQLKGDFLIAYLLPQHLQHCPKLLKTPSNTTRTINLQWLIPHPVQSDGGKPSASLNRFSGAQNWHCGITTPRLYKGGCIALGSWYFCLVVCYQSCSEHFTM